MLQLQPVTLKEANSFVTEYHRHHPGVRGCKFCIAVNNGDRVVGVAIVGRPVSRVLDDGASCELVRLCTDGTPNAASMLAGAARRAARALYYDRLITYILEGESGVSLRAAGWEPLYTTSGRSWDCPSRPRVDMHVITGRQLWDSGLKESVQSVDYGKEKDPDHAHQQSGSNLG